MPTRAASRPSSPSAKKTAPSSISARVVVSTRQSAVGQDFCRCSQTVRRSDCHEKVSPGEREVGVRRRAHLSCPHDGDDGHSGTRAHAGVPEGLSVVARTVLDVELFGSNARKITVLFLELSNELGGAPRRLLSAAASSVVRGSEAAHASGSSALETMRSV